MSALLSNEYFLFPSFALSVFVFSYFNCDRIINFLHRKSLGNREVVMDLMDRMFIETNKKKVTALMLLGSFGLGFLIFIALWPKVGAGFFIGSVVTIVGWSIPKIVMTALWEKRCNKVVDQFIDGMTIMSNGVKSGLSITQSMERAEINMKGPLPQEFRLVLNKTRLGMSVEEALNEFADRIPRPDVQMLVTSVNILKETGGNLAETFQTIVTTVRERQKIEKKIQAMTAQGLMQGIIITLVPFFLFVVFLVIDPNYVKPLYTTTLGYIALFIMLCLQVIGGIMMKKIVTIKV